MALFAEGDVPPAGLLIREALVQALGGDTVNQGLAGPMLEADPGWSADALEAVVQRIGWNVDESARIELAGITERVGSRLGAAEPDGKDVRNAIDNLQSLMVIALLVTDVRGSSVIDGSSIDTAYRLTCPVYPCTPATEAGLASVDFEARL